MLQHAGVEYVFDILRMIKEGGEDKVDIRNPYETIAAIQEGRFHLLIDCDTGAIIGFASIYCYMAGEQQHNELGTILLLPTYRGFGIADFSIIFSCLYSMLADPGSICVTEIYHDSVKAKAVLERNGFRQVVPCRWRVHHAKASPDRPVIHLELGHEPLPVMAGQLLVWLNGGAIVRNGVKLHIHFGDAYWLNTDAGREVIGQISRGDLSALRNDDEAEAPKPPKGNPPHPAGPTSGRRNRSH